MSDGNLTLLTSSIGTNFGITHQTLIGVLCRPICIIILLSPPESTHICNNLEYSRVEDFPWERLNRHVYCSVHDTPRHVVHVEIQSHLFLISPIQVRNTAAKHIMLKFFTSFFLITQVLGLIVFFWSLEKRSLHAASCMLPRKLYSRTWIPYCKAYEIEDPCHYGSFEPSLHERKLLTRLMLICLPWAKEHSEVAMGRQATKIPPKIRIWGQIACLVSWERHRN